MSTAVPSLPDVFLGATKGARSAVILCHGLGDTSDGWSETVSAALAPYLPETLFILPTAPTQPVTINGGAPCPSWYDIESLSTSRSLEKCAGLDESVARLTALVRTQVAAGIPESRIGLVGFSQGGALSLFTALTWAGPPLAGAFVLSGYLPRAAAVKPTPAVAGGTLVRLYHGDEDRVVPLVAAHDAEARATALGLQSVRLSVYPGMAHSASAQELRELVKDLKGALSPAPPPPTEEQLAAMPAKELKAWLVAANAGSARIAACIEKADLLALALEVLKK